MSRALFVNIQNSRFNTVTRNAMGAKFGLGVARELTTAERTEFGQTSADYELYFTESELLEKKRKIELIYDSFTDPRFFAAGAPLPSIVNKYLPDDIPQINAIEVAAVIADAQALSVGNNELDRERVARHAWKMTKTDFPLLTGQARRDGDPRSILRLYDKDGFFGLEIGGDNTLIQNAIARVVREALGDALFSRKFQGSSTYISIPEHPQNKDPQALSKSRHFEFSGSTGFDEGARTYAFALKYLKSYIDLINDIINVTDETLSRSLDIDLQKTIELNITLTKVLVPLLPAIEDTAKKVINEKILTYFDEDREYKTVLNFGGDQQYLAEAWRGSPSSSGSVQLKLTRPLDTDITLNSSAFISRELAKSVIDTIEFKFLPPVDTTPYLRPFNINERNIVSSKIAKQSATLQSLGVITGSAGTVLNQTTATYEDTVFRRWLTEDFKSSELNIDFGDYNKFVHFGSAYARLKSFSEKLKKIEQLTSASTSVGPSSNTILLRRNAQEAEEFIRKFDPYERFLYYAPQDTPYFARAFYTDSEIEYHVTGSWPKQSDGKVHSPYSVIATDWLNTQLNIAQRYDENNPNYLPLNIPRHIREDLNSAEFVQLLNMVGHLMDNIKVYIDQFSNIYSTNPDPQKELTMDQVYEVAQSFGLKLPNVYAAEELQQVIGESGSLSQVAETWKRFLHSMIYFVKTKGSRTSFDAVLNAYGISSPILQIKETTYPSQNNFIQSDELTYGLLLTKNVSSSIRLPFVSSSITASTVQLRFNPIARQTSSILTTDTWAVDLIPHPSASITQYITKSFDGTLQEITMTGTDRRNYGRIEVVSGSARTVIASSSYFPLFSDDYTNIMLRSQSADITIIQTDGDQVLFQESASLNLGTLWNNTIHLNIGGSGSLKLSSSFDGVVDEVRIWKENISTDDFVEHSYDPGSYYGTTYTSSYTNLYVHLAFSQPLASITSSATNESPYQNLSVVSNLPTIGFTTASYFRITRHIRQLTPIVGSTVYTNKKVVVASPPVFNGQFVDQNGTKVLSSKLSIKQLEEKQYNSGQNVVSFAVSPTDFINQNIMRSMGVVDVNNIIGSPRYIANTTYTSLQDIQQDYMQYFNKTINPNQYVRFFKDLIQGPVEMANEMVPARAKLLDGIVIESPVLSRNKEKSIGKFAVDGSGTKGFNAFVMGSGSVGIGAYDFDKQVQTVTLLPTWNGDTLLIEGTVTSSTHGTMGDILQLEGGIVLSGSLRIQESTNPNKLPIARRVTQQVNDNYLYGLATSSIQDDKSSYATLEAQPITVTSILGPTTSNGYPRNPYLGTTVIPSENNTVIPFYGIEPRADLSDVGTTTYFHKFNGIYSYDIYTQYKTEYLVKLDTDATSPLDRLYARVALLPPSSVLNSPGRKTTQIGVSSYTSGDYTTGVITMDNIFSLYDIDGISVNGLRLRLYRSDTDRGADRTRAFTVTPLIGAGVLFDGILTDGLVFPYTLIQTGNKLLYYSIDNTTANTIETDIVFTHFTYEPTNLVPLGYLPRHYKFSRDNTTGLKRRNYLGCKIVDTLGYTGAGGDPVEITTRRRNTATVPPAPDVPTPPTPDPDPTPVPTGPVTIRIDGINFGGGGQLKVE